MGLLLRSRYIGTVKWFQNIDIWAWVVINVLAVGAALNFVFEIIESKKNKANITNLMRIKLVVSLIVVVASIAQPFIQIRQDANQKAESIKQSELINDLHSKLLEEKARIKSITALINITFTGDWSLDKPPYSNEFIEAPLEFLDVFTTFLSDPTRSSPIINFYPVKMYRFQNVSQNEAIFIAEVAPKITDEVFGKHFDYLEKISGSIVNIPIIWPERISTNGLRVTKAIIELNLNGVKKGIFTEGVASGRTQQLLLRNSIKRAMVSVSLDYRSIKWEDIN